MRRFFYVLWVNLILILSSQASNENFMEFGDINFGRNFKEKSKWIIKTGMGYIKYPSALPSFNGVHENIKTGETNELNSYAFSFGRDFYIAHSWSTSLFLGGLYSKTLDKVLGKAASDIDIDFSHTRTAHLLVGYEAALALNYIFDYKLLDIQPFIEFGAGVGSAEVEKEYTRLGLAIEESGDENYNVKTKEEFNFTRLSVGVNFVSYKGLMSYFKATSMQMLKTSRKVTGTTKALGSPTVTNVSSHNSNLNESEVVTVLEIGIGSYF